jgi:hypothetical protein
MEKDSDLRMKWPIKEGHNTMFQDGPRGNIKYVHRDRIKFIEKYRIWTCKCYYRRLLYLQSVKKGIISRKSQ